MFVDAGISTSDRRPQMTAKEEPAGRMTIVSNRRVVRCSAGASDGFGRLEFHLAYANFYLWNTLAHQSG